MVVRCGYMQRALGPGQRPRRDAVPGKGVALEFAVPVPASHDFAALDGDLAGKGAGLDRLGMLRKQEIRDQDHGHLVFLAQVERFNSGPEAVLHIHRRDDRARIVTLGGAEYLIQIALLRLRGNAGRRPAALHFHDYDRGLDHSCHPDGLCHQGKTTAGSAAHRADAGIPRANRHVDDSQFVFTLLDDHAALLGVTDHPVENG